MDTPDEPPGLGRHHLIRMLAGGVALLGGILLATGRGTSSASLRDPHGPDIGRGEPSTPPSTSALAEGFETEDMSARDMSWLVAGLGTSAAIAVGLMLLMLLYFQNLNRAEAPRLTPEQQVQITPPLPNLQADPVAELAQQRAREEALLHGYAWANPDHTKARIPIDRAMALTVGQSLDNGP
jgi:hypothetical protein